MSANNSDECHLLRLNDDCFYEIYKHLQLIDWCSLRETCTRLRTISDDCFNRQCKTFELNGYYILGVKYSEVEMKDIKPLFRNFGQFLSKLVVNSNVFAPNVEPSCLIPFLDRYCTALKDLKLVKIECNAETIEQCDRLFSSLERLVIDKCNDDNATFATCYAHCRSLKELELIRLFNIEGNSLAHHHDTLESLSIKSCDNINYEFIQEFIVQNPQLKALKFVGCNFITDQVFQQISENLPNLEALSLRVVHVGCTVNENLMQLLRLTQLKKFEMNCGLLGINPFLNGLAANNLIETLHLSTVEISEESIQALCNLKTIKVLKLTSTIQLDGEVCKKLAIELPALSEIHIVECSDTTIKEVQEFAEHSTTLKKLVFVRYSDDTLSLSKDSFLSLVAARQRNPNKETLNVHLDFDDHRELKDQFLWEGNLELLKQHVSVINLLPVEDEDDKLPIYEYGAGNRTFRCFYEDIENLYDDDPYYDQFDDDMDDIDDDYDDDDEVDDDFF